MTVFSSIVMTALSTDEPAMLSNPMSVICESSTPGSPSIYKKTFIQNTFWLITLFRFVLTLDHGPKMETLPHPRDFMGPTWQDRVWSGDIKS